MVKKVLLLGGSGFVGRHVCAALARLGHPVGVATRHSRHAQALQVWPTVTIHPLDVMDDAALGHLVRQYDLVVHLIAVLQGDEARFDALHVQLPRRVAQACALNGVSELIHLSALGADPEGPSMYQRSKGRGEQALREVAQAKGLKLTLIRPSVIFGSDDRFINLFARLQKLAPVIPLAGADSRLQPVWVQDVAQVVAQVVRDPHASGGTLELGGPEVLTLAELVHHAGRWAACPRPIVPLPYPLAWMQAVLMECLPGEPLMSRDNLASLQVDNVLTGRYKGLVELGWGRGAGLASVFPA